MECEGINRPKRTMGGGNGIPGNKFPPSRVLFGLFISLHSIPASHSPLWPIYSFAFHFHLTKSSLVYLFPRIPFLPPSVLFGLFCLSHSIFVSKSHIYLPEFHFCLPESFVVSLFPCTSFLPLRVQSFQFISWNYVLSL